MPYYNSAKPVVHVSILVFLFASLPLGYAVLQSLTGLLINVTQVQFIGSLVCSPSGNLPPAPGSGSLGAAGTLVSGSCNGGSGDLGSIVTNTGDFVFAANSLVFGSILLNSTQGMPCNFIVKLPATGTSCQLFPPTGVLVAGVRLLRLTVNAAGEIIAVFGLLPFEYVPVASPPA